MFSFSPGEFGSTGLTRFLSAGFLITDGVLPPLAFCVFQGTKASPQFPPVAVFSFFVGKGRCSFFFNGRRGKPLAGGSPKSPALPRSDDIPNFCAKLL